MLEVGSGHRPHSRSDVLTDKYLEDVERGEELLVDRPFVQADAQQLPFKSEVFGYVICRHVLEHLEEPEAFFHEISRVAHAGYIETPSVIWEHLHPTRFYHRWYVLEIDDELVAMRKPSDHTRLPFGKLFEVLNKHSPEYRLFTRRYADLLFVRYQWDNEISYCINPSDDARRSWFTEPWDEDKVARFVPARNRSQQAFELLSGAIGSLWGGLLRRLNTPFPSVRRRPIELQSLMQCPMCSCQTIEINRGQAQCPTCGWTTVVKIPE